MTELQDEKNPTRCCSYCLLPPTVIGKKLKRCSICHNAWYHDAECQKKHFSVHKKECRRQQQQQQQQHQRQMTTRTNINNINNYNNNNNSGSPEFDVQERKGRGKCLIALSKLRKGQRIIPSKLKPQSQSQLSVEEDRKKKKKKIDFWMPLILPVLHEEYRTTRCALCFNQLQTESSYSFDDDDDGGTCSSNSLSLLSSSSSSLPPKEKNQNQNNRNHPSPLYVLLFCSKSCREVAANTTCHYNLDREEQVVRRLLDNGNGPPRILSTAILLYRILIHESRNNNSNNNDTYIRDQLRQLQSKKTRRTDIEFDDTSTISNNGNMNDDNDNESSNKLHTQGVIATVMGMLQYSSELSLPYNSNPPSMVDLIDMVHTIKVNGFSIYGGEEFTAYGVGIFGTPSYMNHSCRPNVLQTFSFQEGKPPSFYVTAFQDIEPNEEICISYTDTSCPRHIRRKRLKGEYYFLCTCEACDNSDYDNGNIGGSNTAQTNDDSRTIGIRCQDCKKSSVVIHAEERMAPTRPSPVYRCTECNKTDFESALKLLRDFDDQISKRGYSKICRPTLNSSTEDMNRTYRSLKKICNMDSWYVQEAGENVLQYYLNELSMQRDNPLQEQQTAWRALKIAEELLVDDASLSSSSPSSSFLTATKDTLTVSTSAFLKYQQLRYKAAKLRLFLIPDPRQSIHDLEIVLKSLSPFFPSDHELIIGLKACLANAMM